MDKLKSQMIKIESENARLTAELIQTKQKLQGYETEQNKLTTKISFDLQQTKEYLHQKETEVVHLRKELENV